MDPLDNLFSFPIIMIDGDIHEKKKLLSLEGDDAPEIILGEADCPYYDFLSVCDRWAPTKDSYEKAQDGKFDTCFVTFMHSGAYIVPWTKAKFKRKLREFVASIPKETPIIEITPEQLKELLLKNKPQGDEPGDIEPEVN